MTPEDLEDALKDLTFPVDENVLVGTATADDAGVYKISDELALIQTVDFFTPVVDDPYTFGQIAVANSLSDVYAMGGVPKTAMNIVAYPMATMGSGPLKEMLAGGASKLKESGAVLLGGHSIDDTDLKYGVSVTGFVHPDRILKNQGLREGDWLILTKPLGTGIINTAIKGGLASEVTIHEVSELMAELNGPAARTMQEFDISACTDVTGFGLIGHLAEMISGTGCQVKLAVSEIPLIAETYDFGSMGLVPVGAHNNRKFREHLVTAPDKFDPVMRDILFDPQTSGGLLFGCNEEVGDELVRRLRDEGIVHAAKVGEVCLTGKDEILLLG